jgi:hypothetical protein
MKNLLVVILVVVTINLLLLPTGVFAQYNADECIGSNKKATSYKILVEDENPLTKVLLLKLRITFFRNYIAKF